MHQIKVVQVVQCLLQDLWIKQMSAKLGVLWKLSKVCSKRLMSWKKKSIILLHKDTIAGQRLSRDTLKESSLESNKFNTHEALQLHHCYQTLKTSRTFLPRKKKTLITKKIKKVIFWQFSLSWIYSLTVRHQRIFNYYHFYSNYVTT